MRADDDVVEPVTVDVSGGRDVPTEKGTLFALLDPQGTSGVTLTEHYAMYPAAAVSGWYFAHPEAKYFAVGKVEKDQVASYSARKGQDVAVSERWLAPNLGYEA